MEYLRYYAAATFESEDASLAAYQRMSRLLFSNNCDLSAYRCLLGGVPILAVVGTQPPAPLHKAIGRILREARGRDLTLEDDLLAPLFETRRRRTRLGPWVELHHMRPRSDPGATTNQA